MHQPSSPLTTLRLVSWNINGIRATIRKQTWPDIVSLKPDIVSVQEIKATHEFMDTHEAQREDYYLDYTFATIRKGYSGVATYLHTGTFDHLHSSSLASLDDQHTLPLNTVDSNSSTEYETKPWHIQHVYIGLGSEEFDNEGRLVTHILYNPELNRTIAYINGYYPQGGRGPHRIEYKIAFYQRVHALCEQYRQQGYSVILCGDFNTTVTDIDLARPKENRKTTGCLPEEREALNLFLQGGYTDTFRYLYPDMPDKYTYWDQITRARDRNVGWRIDYFIISNDLLDNLTDAYIWSDIMGSDHCPVGIDLTF